MLFFSSSMPRWLKNKVCRASWQAILCTCWPRSSFLLHCVCPVSWHSGNCLHAFCCVSPALLFPLDLCLLACHPKPIIMKIVFVQVCFESTGYTRAIPTTALSRLNSVDWWTCCSRGIIPPHPTKLAMVSAQSIDPASTTASAEAVRTMCCHPCSCL